MVNAAAECDPTERQGFSIRNAMRRTLVTVCDMFQLVQLQSVGCELRLREGVF